MKKLTSLLIASVLFVAYTSTSSAQILTEGPLSSSPSVPSTLTDWTSSLGFAQFNPALGTLVSVELTFSSQLSTTLTVTNLGSGDSNGQVKTELAVAVEDSGNHLGYSLGGTPQLDYLSSAYAYTLASGDSSTSGTITTGSHTGGSTSDDVYTDADILAEFTGTGSVNLTGTTHTLTDLSNTGGNTTSSQVTSANLTGTVTYEYIPAALTAPEPSSWAMMLGGLGVLAFLQRRVRRS